MRAHKVIGYALIASPLIALEIFSAMTIGIGKTALGLALSASVLAVVMLGVWLITRPAAPKAQD